MSLIAQVIHRLKTELVPDTLVSVEGAASLLMALDQLKAGPAAFVMPSARRVGENKSLTGVTCQHIMPAFTVAIGFTRAGATGGGRLDEIEEVSNAVLATLFGWKPDGMADVVTHLGGRIASMNAEKHVIFWGDDFATGLYIRK
jgi:hypothetical protein